MEGEVRGGALGLTLENAVFREIECEDTVLARRGAAERGGKGGRGCRKFDSWDESDNGDEVMSEAERGGDLHVEFKEGKSAIMALLGVADLELETDEAAGEVATPLGISSIPGVGGETTDSIASEVEDCGAAEGPAFEPEDG